MEDQLLALRAQEREIKHQLRTVQQSISDLLKDKAQQLPTTTTLPSAAVLDTELRFSPLPTRARNILMSQGIFTVRQLRLCTREQLLAFDALGVAALSAIVEYLNQLRVPHRITL